MVANGRIGQVGGIAQKLVEIMDIDVKLDYHKQMEMKTLVRRKKWY